MPVRFWAELRVSDLMETAERGEEKGRRCRGCGMTAECNGYLGQLPTLSGLQVADPGMADGWTDMK
jgi:hypothetical protein